MTDPSPLGEAPRLRLDLDKAAAHVVGFCRQVAHDGILPSLAWFSETAETVDALRARSRDDLAAWREQDQALQDIFGACGVDAIISAPSDVARIVIELLAEGAARRGPQPEPELLSYERLLELCDLNGITETDDLKHRLEDWERWNAEHRTAVGLPPRSGAQE